MMRLALCFFAFLLVASSVAAQQDRYQPLQQLMSQDGKERRQAADQLLKSPDISLVPALVDALFFTPKKNRGEIVKVLERYTGEKIGADYYDWVELIGRRTEFKPSDDYVSWKASLLSRIDPTYKKILNPPVTSRIRLEEVVWGGVKFDGIPTLHHPPHVKADDAAFMQDEEKVFALKWNGHSRAYPLRVLSWHEMTNDVLGGEPITISF